MMLKPRYLSHPIFCLDSNQRRRCTNVYPIQDIGKQDSGFRIQKTRFRRSLFASCILHLVSYILHLIPLRHQSRFQKFGLIHVCLFIVTFVNFPCFADDISATFTFGKIEILKDGEREWSFLKKGTELTERDLVRMPPVSLIRLKAADGTLLPTLPGGRELSIGDLIVEGIGRKKATKGKRINGNFDSRPATDVLPLGEEFKESNHAPAPNIIQCATITQSELKELRYQLDALPDEIVIDISQLSFRNSASSEAYPYPTLERAKALYEALETDQVKTAKLKPCSHSLLYTQLLRHFKIDADLIINEKGELLTIFDSKVPRTQAKWIAANQKLIHEKQGKDTLWMPIQVQPQIQNFTVAWYQGSQM